MSVVGCKYVHVCSYNDVREGVIVINDVSVPLPVAAAFLGVEVEDIVNIEEDFPENRADPDFFTFYFFAVVFPLAALLTVAHLILHGVPIAGFIVSLVVSVCMYRCLYTYIG